jgi:hypothetical protein
MNGWLPKEPAEPKPDRSLASALDRVLVRSRWTVSRARSRSIRHGLGGQVGQTQGPLHDPT